MKSRESLVGISTRVIRSRRYPAPFASCLARFRLGAATEGRRPVASSQNASVNDFRRLQDDVGADCFLVDCLPSVQTRPLWPSLHPHRLLRLQRIRETSAPSLGVGTERRQIFLFNSRRTVTGNGSRGVCMPPGTLLRANGTVVDSTQPRTGSRYYSQRPCVA